MKYQIVNENNRVNNDNASRLMVKTMTTRTVTECELILLPAL